MVQLKKKTEKNSHFVKQIEGSDWCALLQIERTRNIPCLGFLTEQLKLISHTVVDTDKKPPARWKTP